MPPDYKDALPEGYHVAHTTTHGNWVIWRGFHVEGSTKPAVEATKKLFRMYPLSEKDNPPEMTFVNISGKFDNTIHRMDYAPTLGGSVTLTVGLHGRLHTDCSRFRELGERQQMAEPESSTTNT